MKRVIFFLSSTLAILFSACDHPQQTGNSAIIVQSDTAQKNYTTTADSTKKKFTVAMVDNKKDPNCGMPVTAGIEDTVHYKGKVYGFCSDECKQAFLKNPEALAKKAELR
jgi:YHS domain-containing protein